MHVYILSNIANITQERQFTSYDTFAWYCILRRNERPQKMGGILGQRPLKEHILPSILNLTGPLNILDKNRAGHGQSGVI